MRIQVVAVMLAGCTVGWTGLRADGKAEGGSSAIGPVEQVTSVRAEVARLTGEVSKVRRAMTQGPGVAERLDLTSAEAQVEGLASTLARHAPAVDVTAAKAELIALRRGLAELARLAEHPERLARSTARPRQLHPDSSLPAMATVSGTLVGAGGLPIAHGSAILHDATGEEIDRRMADDKGAFSLDIPYPGAYYLSAEARGYATAALGGSPCGSLGCDLLAGEPLVVDDEVGLQAVVLALTRAGSIAGRVVDAAGGGPLVGAIVSIYASSGELSAWTVTAADGRYEVDSLAPGSYFARAAINTHRSQIHGGGVCANCSLTAGREIAVTAGGVASGIDFELSGDSAITGRVVDESTGAPIANAMVRADGLVTSGGWSPTDAAGRYFIGGLLEGQYHLSVRAPEHGGEIYMDLPCAAPAFCPWNCDFTNATPITTSLGQTVENVDFALTRLGSIGGQITTTVDVPLSGIEVRAYTEDSCYAGVASSGTDGSYRVDYLPAGDYRAATYSETDYLDENFDDLVCPSQLCYPPTGILIPVQLATTTLGIDFELELGGTVRGFVRDANTAAGLATNVLVFDPGGGLYAPGQSAPGTGEYAIGKLPSGTYRAQTFSYFSLTGPYRHEVFDGVPCPANGCPGDSSGDPVVVVAASETAGIDFDLEPLGRISGTVTDAVTGELLNAQIELRGDAVASTSTLDGSFELIGVYPGTYYVVADASQPLHLNEIYEDVPCWAGSCDNSAGTAIEVELGSDVTGIDFALERGPGINGVVVRQADGEPISGVAVDVWGPGGGHVAAGASDSMGSYYVNVGPGTYYVSTDNGLGARDEVFDDVACPAGPAYLGLCDPTAGTAVTVLGGPPVEGVNFALSLFPAFADGFEDGGTLAWSAAVP